MANKKYEGDFHVTCIPRVEIRCQFKTVPGVTHITLVYDPYTRGSKVSGNITCPYGDIPLTEQVIISAICDNTAAGALYMLKRETFNEIAEALKAGSEKLRLMNLAVNK